MRRAIFFSGLGTSYSKINGKQDSVELYPETLPALRFLARRGFELVLISAEYQEFKLIRCALKDKSLNLHHWDTGKENLENFCEKHEINQDESYFITDGLYLNYLIGKKCRVILVLSGEGFSTLAGMSKQSCFIDICKDIYAAAFSVALSK